MSASILWEPVNPEPDSFGVMAPNAFMEEMARAGMELPCELGEEHVPMLIGMAAVAPDRPYAAIIKAINEHTRIRVWAQW